jgi:hypothetical protein
VAIHIHSRIEWAIDDPVQFDEGSTVDGWVEAISICSLVANWVWVAGGSSPRCCRTVASPVLVGADQVQSNRMEAAEARRS